MGLGEAANRRRAAELAWTEGLEGRFRSMEQVAWRLQSDVGPEARAWGHALRALRWHAEPELGALPTLEQLDGVEGHSEETSHALMRAAAQAAKGAALRFRADEVLRWAAWTSARTDSSPDRAEPTEALAWRLVVSAWGHLVSGDAELAERVARDACACASSASAGAALVDATALVALATSQRDADAALEVARRGSRMSRTEGLPQGEYLANVVLARLRRLAGRPHHATRILGALARVASTPWRPWIVWELALAGGLEPARNVDLDLVAEGSSEDVARRAARAFRSTLFAAQDGDRATFDVRAKEARAALRGFEPLTADLANALTAIDPRAAPVAEDAQIGGWLRGAETRTPPALRGLSGVVEASVHEEGTGAFVVADPDGTARRVVSIGHALAAPDLRIEPQRGRPGRVETLLATLALAPGGLEPGDLFRSVYGFAYAPPLHRDLFKQLIYRARSALGSVGTIRRVGEAYQLDLVGRLLVPDPRCEQPLEDLVLRFLARNGTGSAKATAATLNISLRKAQQALALLAEEGAVAIDKHGRRVSYRLEDTTFSEPTRA